MLASINASTQQLLLIGDHQQLRPSAACHELTLRYGITGACCVRRPVLAPSHRRPSPSSPPRHKLSTPPLLPPPSPTPLPLPTLAATPRRHPRRAVSLFERLFNNKVPYVRLRTQRRMRPSIAKLIAPIYPELLNHQTTHGRPRVAGFTTSVHFITHEAPEHRGREDLLSPENPHEVRTISPRSPPISPSI